MAMHFKKQEKTEAERKKSTERRGFYLALAVCLTAIGIAGVEHIRYRFRVLDPQGARAVRLPPRPHRAPRLKHPSP